MITKIDDLYEISKKQEKTKRLVLAVAQDHHALDAAYKAYKQGIIQPILVGYKIEIDALATKHGYNLSGIEIIDELDKQKAVEIAVKLVKDGKAEILMKGNVATATLLRAVLNKDHGLGTGTLISHLALFELPTYHKLIGLTDVAMNILPDLHEKTGIINNAVRYLNKIGIENPKVAILAAVEVVNPKMPATVDAAILAKMNHRNQITDCIIDGPLAFDNALSKESAEHKGIESKVAGDADLLVLPNIEAGNVLYKSFAMNGARLAAVILGAKVPIVLTSRSDSEESKLNSILLAAVS